MDNYETNPGKLLKQKSKSSEATCFQLISINREDEKKNFDS